MILEQLFKQGSISESARQALHNTLKCDIDKIKEILHDDDFVKNLEEFATLANLEYDVEKARTDVVNNILSVQDRFNAAYFSSKKPQLRELLPLSKDSKLSNLGISKFMLDCSIHALQIQGLDLELINVYNKVFHKYNGHANQFLYRQVKLKLLYVENTLK